MSGKYRKISTAEKRAMLEAAGEEWPIGNDGLPKVWHSSSDRRAGGHWKLRTSKRATNIRYKNTDRGRLVGRTAEALYERSCIRIKAGGLRFVYRIDPEKKDELKAKLAEFREQQTRTHQEVARNGWID